MNARTEIAPNITYTPCESSQVSAFGYDPVTQTLGVRFKAGSGSTYHYHGVPPEVFEAMKTCDSVGKFIGSSIKGVYAYDKQPDSSGIVFGLSTAQEPKYTVATSTGRLTNRSTGKPIPDDEPVMVFRAQDKNVVPMLWAYYETCKSADHKAVIKSRIADFERFAAANPDRMKEPDSNLVEVSTANLTGTAVRKAA